MKPYVEMDLAELARVWNELIVSDAAKHLGHDPVVKFRDRPTGIKRILLLEKEIKEGNGKPKASPEQANSVEKILSEQFRARPGSKRWKMLKVLLDEENTQVPIKKLAKAVYGSDDEKMGGALTMVWSGVKVMITKWKLDYEARKEKDDAKNTTYGLHKT